MKAAKDKNAQDQFISPASRGNGIDNTIAPSDYNSNEPMNPTRKDYD